MSLRYPESAGGAGGDYVTFTPIEYRSNARGGSAPPAGPGGGSDAITLYMPNSTPVMGNGNSWGEINFQGPLGALRRDAHRALTQGTMDLAGGRDVGQAAESVTQTLNAKSHMANGKNIAAQAVLQMIPQELSGATANQMLALQTGQVFNPNVELLYQAPGFRQFAFNFDFVPRNPSDATNMNNIIRSFKSNSAPRDIGNGMFEVPKVWQIRYMSGAGENQFMNKFKPSACLSVSVQANQPTDMHVSFANGIPVQTTMSLMFKEVDIITRKDHENAAQGF